MKRDALKHPKMLDLAARLGITHAQAIGHVTMLIDWVIDYATQGDIGKWPNGSIARGAGWDTSQDTSPDEFVTALVASGWLDEHETHRIIVHDWPDHAERFVRSKLASQGKEFLQCYSTPKIDTSKDTSQDVSGDTGEDPPRASIQSNPCLIDKKDLKSIFDGLDEETQSQAEQLAGRISRATKTPLTHPNAHMLLGYAVGSVTGKLPIGVVDGVIDRMAGNSRIKKPWPYFEASVQKAIEGNGHD